MAKILSTFSKLEQSRFEAFKRVSFPCNSVAQYVAQCLAERQQPSPLEPVQQQHPASHQSPSDHHHHPDNSKRRHFPPIRQVFSAGSPDNRSTTTATASRTGNRPQLHDLVVPGQEEEITTVVTTLAKAYAQRLCAAAKAQAVAAHAGGRNNDSNNNHNAADPAAATEGAAIQPQHVLQAFYKRTQQGQDPGFFLQPNESIVTVGSAMNNDGKEQLKRVAALAAQEEFQKSLQEYETLIKSREQQQPAEEKADGSSNSVGGGGGSDEKAAAPATAEDDSDSGDEAEVDLMEQEMEEEMTNT